VRTLAVAVVVAATAAAPAHGSAVGAFHTPGWAAECFVPVAHERPLSQTGLVCITPKNGFTISMGAADRPTYRYRAEHRGYREPFSHYRLLRFGRYWAVKPYWFCSSKATGLMCWNKAGRGWWLGRAGGFRVF
jgi:hypothetical protein